MMSPAQKRQRVDPSDRPPLFLTNYRGGGIGDFGATLWTHLVTRLKEVRIEETSIDGAGSLRQSIAASTYRGHVIANLGLTAWGRSGARNLIGFASLGIHQSLGLPTTAIVHHAIEMLEPKDTGYDITPAVRYGAHFALRCLSACNIVVFSPGLLDLLRRDYDARAVWLTPIPGDPVRLTPKTPAVGRRRIVNAGYWAPYKGIDLFLDVAEQLGSAGDFYLVGRPHALLLSDPTFRAQVEQWKSRASRLGVRLPGFLSPDQLDAMFAEGTIGVLPYSSTSGASASFQLFAERGIPVIASDIPEFRFLEQRGAGVLIAPPTVEGMSSAIVRLSEDSHLWLLLAKRQADFSDRYSWGPFLDGLLNRVNV
jgi:glycosyltransferase involved in cell wall biosynthesis